jgi:hypothetical protein
MYGMAHIIILSHTSVDLSIKKFYLYLSNEMYMQKNPVT